MSTHRFPVVIGLFLTACASAQVATPEAFKALDRKWQYYQSPNFELYSTEDPTVSRDVLENMELLRAVFLDTLKLAVRMPQPVTIYLFDRDKDFEAYMKPALRGGTAKYDGFCTSFPDRTVITLAPTPNEDTARQVVYHEYIHYLFRIGEQSPAPWYNEGLAELFSTIREDRDWLILGHPVGGRVRDLQFGKMVPFEQLFATRYDSPIFRDSGHTGLFYAQSWLLLHYLAFGVNKIPPERLSLFLRVAASPEIQERPDDFRADCRELIGLDYPDLLREMKRYLGTGRFSSRKVKRPEIAPRSSYASRPAARDEMAAQLAELSLRQTGSAYASWFVRDLTAREPSIRLYELLGAIAMNDGENEVAREQWNRAVELGTTNAAIFRELGRLEANAAFSSFDLDYQMPAERAERLRRLLKRSIECAPEQSQGYEMLAWVEASVLKPNIPNVNLIQRRIDTLNDKARTVLALAILRLRRGEKDEALRILDHLQALNPSDWVLHCAEVTRARIEARPVDPARLPKLDPQRPAGIMALPGKLELPR